MSVPNAYGSRPEWSYVTETRAAKSLGVGVELIRGLCSQGHIESFYTLSKTGVPMYLVRESELPGLLSRMSAVS